MKYELFSEHFLHKSAVFFPKIRKIPHLFRRGIMVDDTRLELVTSRTSSGCATSCANRPFLCQLDYSTTR